MKRHPFFGGRKKYKKIVYNPTELAEGMYNVFKISTMITERKMIAGEYLAGDSTFSKRQRRSKTYHRLNVTEYRITKTRNNQELIPNAGQIFILNLLFFDYGYNIHCGDNVFFNVNCVVLDCTQSNYRF
jgi:maltose O-acetyltransferase